MSATIRRGTPDDIPRLVQLLGQLFSIESDFAPDPERQARGLARLLVSDAVVLVAVLDEVAIGMVTVQFVISTAEGGTAAWLEDMVVDARHRGCGFGRDLLAAACGAAAERGCTRIQLVADDGNAPALDFYRRSGWSATRLRTWRCALPSFT